MLASREHVQQMFQDPGIEVPIFTSRFSRSAGWGVHSGADRRLRQRRFSKPRRSSSVLGPRMLTGGALENCAIGSLGIMPHISATIIVQLRRRCMALASGARRGRRTKLIQPGGI
jgi:hypothetical protein